MPTEKQQAKQRTCSICGNEIEKQYTPAGEVYWDIGHNPAPVKNGEFDRCCGNCNTLHVIPARLATLTAHGF